MPGVRRPVARRLLALSTLAAIGGAAFVPFLAAASNVPAMRLALFPVVVTVVSAALAWPGLRCADRVGLPMPLLRRLDGDHAGSLSRSALWVTLVAGIALGIAGAVALELVRAPALPASPGARVLSTLFAAGPLEIVLHLGIMSIVVWLAGGRRWVGIAVSALCLVAFHLTGGAFAQPVPVLWAIILGNGAMGGVFGWLYARHGFECAMLGHAAAHLITVLAG